MIDELLPPRTKIEMKQPIRQMMMVFSVLALVGTGCSSPLRRNSPPEPTTTKVTPTSTSIVTGTTTATVVPEKAFGIPIANAKDRVTIKPFGLYVTKANSPVQPERFAGYHTGVDFETFDNEKERDIAIYAICDGPLLLKKWAAGYGGVVVQKCLVENEVVTVIYGHLRILSISQEIGHELKKGEQLGVLGKGYSGETDNERKHLHLGIHKSATIDIRGYVLGESDLKQWLDLRELFLNL